jgi:nitronate monooxygenase
LKEQTMWPDHRLIDLFKTEFPNLWAGQAVRLGREMPAAELTRALAGAALARLSRLAG